MIPEQVKILRQRFGETQAQFARRCNVSVGTVANWESGRSGVSGTAAALLHILWERKADESVQADR